MGRLKTGTPARLDGSHASTGTRAGDRSPATSRPSPFSFLTERIATRRSHAASPRPTTRPTRIIAANLARVRRSTAAASPAAARAIAPRSRTRWSASPTATSHQIFLEPEGLDDDTVYPNGVSTSVPADVQDRSCAPSPAWSMSRMLRPGYAIEYDYVDPRELTPSLRLKRAAGPLPCRPDQRHDRLRGGGGAGPGRRAQRRPPAGGGDAGPLRPRRGLYRGDDRRSRHPGRDRALSDVHLAGRIPPALRADNADLRLTPRGIAWGVVGSERIAAFRAHEQALAAGAAAPALPPRARATLAADALYAGYLKRQEAEDLGLPPPGEGASAGRARLPQDRRPLGGTHRQVEQIRPPSLGAASRIPGMTPAALAALAAHLSRNSRDRPNRPHVSRET